MKIIIPATFDYFDYSEEDTETNETRIIAFIPDFEEEITIVGNTKKLIQQVKKFLVKKLLKIMPNIIEIPLSDITIRGICEIGDTVTLEFIVDIENPYYYAI